MKQKICTLTQSQSVAPMEEPGNYFLLEKCVKKTTVGD